MHPELKRPDKQLWPGISKAELAIHLATVAPAMLPHLKDRPLTLVRAPDGVEAHRFYQKDAHHLSKDLKTCSFDGVAYVLARSPDDLVRLADQAAVELHGWTSRCDRPGHPDRIVFDLDPPDDSMFPVVRRAAQTLVDLIQEAGGTPFVLLTGSKGIHVVMPIRRGPDYDSVRRFTDAVARVMVRHDKDLTTELRKRARKGRVFVDTLRNRPRQTSVIPWSPRARPEGSFAVPVPVSALSDKDLDPRTARLGEAEAWLADDPWQGFFAAAARLPGATPR